MGDMEALGRRIRRAREDKKWSQSELGRRWGSRSHAAISDIERGKTKVPADELLPLAELLGVPLRKLLTDDPAKAQFFRQDSEESLPASDVKKVREAFETHARQLWAEKESQ